MASLVYLILYIYLHACSARPLVQCMKDSISRSLVAMQFHNDQKVSAVKEFEAAAGTKGNKIKLHEYLKILQNAADSTREEILMKRAVRSTLESAPTSPCSGDAEETDHVNSTETSDARVEDIVVMDYAQPHRKPPIHNRGT